MASYSTTPDGNGGFTVQVKQPQRGVTFHSFSTEAEAKAWVIEQIQMEEEADRFERSAPRNWRG